MSDAPNKSFTLGRFELIAFAAAALAAWHSSRIDFDIDQITLVLLATSAISFVLPEFASRLTKFKFGELEAEFEKSIGKLEEKVVAAESAAPLKDSNSSFVAAPLHDSYVKEYEGIISSPTSGREKIVLGAILAERMIDDAATEANVAPAGRRLPARYAMRKLVEEGRVPAEEGAAFDEFWNVRNQVVHGATFTISEQQVSRVLDLLWRLVKVFG